jgi:hypothetical protein
MDAGSPNPEQEAAIRQYAKDHGKTWKKNLSDDWMVAGSRWDGPYYLLQQVRNTLGPAWLWSFKL